jgi:uncharacterized membrane protein YagU involved in acid resistance
MFRIVVVLGLLAALAACGSEAPPPPPAPAAKAERTPTVFDDQLKTMDKAKAVEEQEMEHKRKLDEQLDGG